MKIPNLEKLNLPEAEKICEEISHEGILTYNNRDYAFLKIADDFIHQLYPILQKAYPTAECPNYFQPGGTGAHITVVYSLEQTTLPEDEFQKSYQFEPQNFYRTVIDNKMYYILLVKSAGLLALRKKYQLPEKLNFKDHAIDFHITFGFEVI